MSVIPPVTAVDPEARSADPVAANVDALKVLFPDAFAEGQIDFDVLRQLLGDAVEDGEEKYGLNWSGKRQARRLALTPSLGTLLPAPEDSVDWDNTRNLMIEGDNLEVLKLLQKSYAGRVKLIYIDPPYNTGNDLLYPNDFSDNIGTYLELTGQKDGDAKLVSNPETGGRYHSNWLGMMYSRLLAAKSLLQSDGVLICTIDDNEVVNLGLLLREVFGEGTYDQTCVTIVHNPRGVQGANFSATHEYAYFVYRAGTKSIGDAKIDEDEIDWVQFRNWGTESLRTDAKNCFYPVVVRNNQVVDFGSVPPDDFHPQQSVKDGDDTLVYPIDRNGVERKWRYARQTVDRIAHLLRPKTISTGYEIELGKDFASYKTVWTDKRHDANVYGSQILKSLVPDSPFLFPKSLWAVYDCVQAVVGDDPDAIVLDFFAGSGTTGHALMEMNKEDGGRRRFILVQLPETIKGHERFANIADLTEERLRRAAQEIKAKNPETNADLGFRVYKLATSNLKAWAPGGDLEADLVSAIDNVVEGRSEDDLLVELLLKQGIDLTEPVVARTIAGRQVHAFGGGVLVVCLGAVTAADAESLADGMVDWIGTLSPPAPTTVFFKDSGFDDDQAKTNVAAILEQRLDDQLLKVRSV